MEAPMSDESKELQVKNDQPLIDSLARVKGQVNLIQHVMRDVMKEGEHYGKIPGCGDKPTLLKGGAEKLLLTFRLAPTYKEISVVEQADFIMYKIECELVHIESGQIMGSGLGACNSRENKYNKRSVPEFVATEDEKAKAIGKEKRISKKTNKEFTVLILPSNPWDQQNTILKMASKRALVAAVLNVTAASDIFTQDIEDFHAGPEEPETKPAPMPQQKKQEDAPAKEADVTQGAKLQIAAITVKNQVQQDAVKALNFKWNAGLKCYTKSITENEYVELCKSFEVELIDGNQK
jgi:hypothetical protein